MPKLILPLFNPYTQASPRPSTSTRHVQLSDEDVAFYQRHCTCVTGPVDKILALLFHAYVCRIRSYESTHGPLDNAWAVDHDTLRLLQRLAVGDLSGPPGARDDGRRTGCVDETLRDDEGISPDPQSGIRDEETANSGDPESREKSESRGRRPVLPRALEQLRDLGIL